MGNIAHKQLSRSPSTRTHPIEGKAVPSQGLGNPLPVPGRDEFEYALQPSQVTVMEWRGLRPVDPDGWLPVTDRSLASIREGIGRQYFGRPRKGRRRLLGPGLVIRHAERAGVPSGKRPVLRNGWKRADGTMPRLPGLLTEAVRRARRCSYRGYGRYLCWAASKADAMKPGCMLGQIRVLIGEQGIGKSAFARAAVPPTMPEFSDGPVGHVRSTQSKSRRPWARVVCEISEMAGRSKAEIEHVKSFKSSPPGRMDTFALSGIARPNTCPGALCDRARPTTRTMPNDPSRQSPFRPLKLNATAPTLEART